MGLIQDYIAFEKMRSKAFSIHDTDKRKQIISDFFDGNLTNINDYQKNQINAIIKSCLRNEISIQQIEQIPWNFPGRDQIMTKVSDHFIEQETLRILNKTQKKEDLFRRICENFFEDGFLLESEKSELDLEANILEIDEENKNKIIEQVRNDKELAKPKDVILEIVSGLKNNDNFTSSEVYSVCKSQKYNLDFEKNDVENILKQKLISIISYNSEKDSFSLIKLDHSIEESESFEYGRTEYTYQINKLDPDHRYITTDPYPSKNKCVLIINSSSHYFEGVNIKENLRGLIYDGILIHRMQKRTSTIEDGDITSIKTDIHKKLKDNKF